MPLPCVIHRHIFNSIFSTAEISKNILIRFECTLPYSRSLRESVPIKYSDIHAMVLLLSQQTVRVSFSYDYEHFLILVIKWAR